MTSEQIQELLLIIPPVVAAFLATFRGISELLLIISRKTENKTDDKLYDMINRCSLFLAKASAFLGAGMPTKLLMDKAEKLALKEVENGKKDDPAKAN